MSLIALGRAQDDWGVELGMEIGAINYQFIASLFQLRWGIVEAIFVFSRKVTVEDLKELIKQNI